MKILYKFFLLAVLSFSIYATTFLLQPLQHEKEWYGGGLKIYSDATKGNVVALVKMVGGTILVVSGLLVFIFYGNEGTNLKDAFHLSWFPHPWSWSAYIIKWWLGFFAVRLGIVIVFNI